MLKKILFVTHPQKNCGIHEYGVTLFNALIKSQSFSYFYAECSSMSDLITQIETHEPVAIIYNYSLSTLPWLTQKIVHKSYQPLNRHIRIPQVGIMHEVTQEKADKATNKIFDYHIAPDPTLLLKNPIVFKTGRVVPEYQNRFELPAAPVIGSFGFATPNKGFDLIVNAVEKEFDEATIRLNIPSADFADKDGANARQLITACEKLITKPGISLVATHEFLDQNGILDFLAQNTLNIFLYQDKENRGLSSTIDYALAVGRPIAVSDSLMFRHLHHLNPSIVYPQTSLKHIINNGTGYNEKLKREWSIENLTWEYDRILAKILAIKDAKPVQSSNLTSVGKLKNKLLAVFGLTPKSFTWLRNTNSAVDDDLNTDSSLSYNPITIAANQPLNRILDNKARKLYEPAITMLRNTVPLTMAKKIPEANVQQAFVFDTVFRMLENNKMLKLLCVGSYEDTASMTLKKMGFSVDEIDPVINYYLQEFYTKPTTLKGSYDIIFSTSVIEHDPDDESFIKCVEGLLKTGGKAVITCDYKDGWQPSDPKPDVDARYYTMNDLKYRLPGYIPNCKLVDAPEWECENPDFNYLGKFQYTFATFVFQKIK